MDLITRKKIMDDNNLPVIDLLHNSIQQVKEKHIIFTGDTVKVIDTISLFRKLVLRKN